MAENAYDRVNDYGAVKISLASPNDIRSWSFGEVKKPETINYRTYRPEKDGLFCERIFGPERDWECACGKYKGTKHKGIICDRCGVKVTHSRVRRKRMGHINLAAPIVHIWFFKALPSRLGTLLGMKTSNLEKVILFQDYVVTRPGQTPLKYQQALTEDEYRDARDKYGQDFDAMMGAEGVRILLEKLELSETSNRLREELKKTSSKQKIKDLTKRLKLVEAIRTSGSRPEWMVMDVIPVIPPDLRPLVLLESGNFATSDLNDLYRRVINRNNRLKKLIDLNAPEVIIRNEKRMLQQAVDALFDNGRCRRPVLGSSNRPLKSLTDMIKGKQGRFRENLLGKRVDYSARSVIVVGPELKLHQCGLPKKIALELFQPFIIRKLRERGLADTIKSAKRMIERKDKDIWDILEEVIHQHPVLLNRAPTLHRMGIQAFEPVLVEGNAIRIHPLVCKGFNADFDGDQMAVHLPLSIEAQTEAHTLMLATNNIFSPASGAPIMSPSQDIVLGIYYLTAAQGNTRVDDRLGRVEFEGARLPLFRDAHEAMAAHDLGLIGTHAPILVRMAKEVELIEKDGARMNETGVVRTTVGRCLFNDVLPAGMGFYNYPLGNKGCGAVISDCYKRLGRSATLDLLDSIKAVGFRSATLAGLSFGIKDVRVPDAKPKILEEAQGRVDQIRKDFENDAITDGERYNQTIDVWVHAREQITKAMLADLEIHEGDDSPRFLLNRLNHFYRGWPDNSLLRQIAKEKPSSGKEEVLAFVADKLEFQYCVVKNLSRDEMQALRCCLMIKFGPKDRLPKYNSRPAFRTAKENCKIYQDRLKEVLEECRKKLDASKWFRKSDVNKASLGEKDSYAQAVIIFRNQENKEICYVGATGITAYLNPLWLMSDSGARGNVDQIRQLAGMRGLMSKPSGEIIETPIKANFREGLTVLEYFGSTHGARKGLADTALKTADSGYLTRKLADVAQNVIIGQQDCGTDRGVTKSAIYKGEQVDVPLRDLIVGRVVARDSIVNPITDQVIIKKNQIITEEIARQIEDLGMETIQVRSPLTCDCAMGICAKCYGVDLSTDQLVEEGMAVGIIAAQSIGEPGTQLTMRTFHTGGVATRAVLENEQRASVAGKIEFNNLNDAVPYAGPKFSKGNSDIIPTEKGTRPLTAKTESGRLWVVIKRQRSVRILDEKDRELEKLDVPYGAYLRFDNGAKVKAGDRLAYWDPHRVPILAEAGGSVRFQDIEDGETVRVESEKGKGAAVRLVVIEHKGEKHPRIVVEDKAGKILDFHYLPAKARIEVEEGQTVEPGDLLARQPREATGTQDITGGLPRVTELFEARKPKEPAAMAEISGRVELRTDKRRGKMTIIVTGAAGRADEEAMTREHHVPHDRHLLVHTGDYVEAGDPLTEGPLVPHDILRIRGEEALQQYLLTEIQSVYRSQKQNINDKHIEIIAAQMLRKVTVEKENDSALLPGDVIDKFRFRQENERLAKSLKIVEPGDTPFIEDEVPTREKVEQANAEAEAKKGKPAKTRKPRPATAKTLLLGITKASLQSESFLSAASFQESTKVFTEAALAGRMDELRGLKENVILGHLLPAGTSFKPYLNMRIKRLVELPALLAAEGKAEMTEAQIQQAVQRALTGQD